jgi:Xaa-Pro aminopeptidase
MPRNRARDLAEQDDEDDPQDSASQDPVATDDEMESVLSCTDSTSRQRVRKEWTELAVYDRAMMNEEEIHHEVMKIATKKMSNAGCLPPDNFRERSNQFRWRFI